MHTQQDENHTHRIAVLIATSSRPNLLNERALSSVEAQSRTPDVIVVVDDSPERERIATRNIVNDIRIGGAQIVYLPNTRTAGLAGALNCGIKWLARHEPDAARTFVAILDDDDCWTHNHLQRCISVAASVPADMVISGIVRKSSLTDPGHKHSIADALDEQTLLAGDTHIQGSNLFVRLDRLLAIGGFDELLRSATDRDLCLRLHDLGNVRVASTNTHTVDHYAERERVRLSSPGTEAKSRGLEAFWWKYRSRMSPQTRAAFEKRAEAHFGWSPPSTPAFESWRSKLPSALPRITGDAPPSPHARELVLVVAVIAGDHRVAGLLDDLLELGKSGRVTTLDVVILENGSAPSPELDAQIERHRAQGLSIFHATVEQQRADATAGVFGENFHRPEGRAPIGPARVMLGAYARRIARQREGAIVWILDDDCRLDNRARRPSPRSNAGAWLQYLPELRQRRADIVLGTVTDAPPVPFSAAIRVQMVDLLHNLREMAGLSPADPLPDPRAHNDGLRRIADDFYYDLSRRDTHLLEYPFWLEPAFEGETVGAAFARMVEQLPRMFAGEQIFRPLLLPEDADPIGEVQPSVQSGANTFIFDANALADFPHAVPRLGDRTLRRSDMIFALLNRFAGGRRVVRSPISVRQDRSNDEPNGLDLERLIPDIQGYALYSALQDVLEERRRKRLRDGLGAQHPDALDFNDGDMSLAVERFDKYLEERLDAFALSFHRIRGVVSSLEALLERFAGCALFAELNAATDQLRGFVSASRDRYPRELLSEVCEQCRRVAAADVVLFLRRLAEIVADHRASRLPERAADEWFRSQRVKNSAALIAESFSPHSLSLLGTGSEGVALTDGVHVFKVFDYAKSAFDSERWDGLRAIIGRDLGSREIHSIDELRVTAGRPVLHYAYEPSVPFTGGHGRDLVRLLRECKRLGLVFTNMHPKNLVVTASSVRLIDYGADLRAHTAELFRSMIKRTWLTIRYAGRPDLSALMRASNHDESLPELRGWERLLAAVDAPAKSQLLDRRLIELVAGSRPERVLDHGCGRGEIAGALAARGMDVVAFDPDVELGPRWAALPEPVRWTHDRASLAEISGSFDAVISSLVLCVVEREDEYQSAIGDLRRALRPSGRLVLAVCNPFETFRTASSFQERIVPAGVHAEDVFVWEKRLASGRARRDVHRPLGKVVGDLERQGLQVEEVQAMGSIDLETFEPARDFLVLTARPRPLPRPRRRSPSPAIPVLCYHRVLPAFARDEIESFQRRRGTIVDLEIFAHHCARMRARFDLVGVEQLASWLNGDLELPANACVVTFDDGYADFADHALPLLSAWNIPAAVFAVRDCAADAACLAPVDELYLRLARNASLSEHEKHDWAFGEKKRAFLSASPEAQRKMLEVLGAPGALPRLYLNEATLGEVAQQGMLVASHATSHHLLTTLSDGELAFGLGASRAWIEALCPRGARFLAYPSGKTDERVAAAARAAGYELAFTVEPRRVSIGDERLRLPRISVPNDPDAIDQIADGREVRI